MSVIAVEITKDKIKFAFDSRYNYADQEYLHPSNPKVFKVNNLIVGMAGKCNRKFYFEDFITNKGTLNIASEIEVLNLIDEYELNNKENSHALFTEEESIFICNYDKVYYIKPYNRTCFEVSKFEVFGAGADYVAGAYEICKDLERSMKVACKLNLLCGEPVNLLEVNRIKA